MFEIVTVTKIPVDRLSAIDLRKEAAEHGGEAYIATIDGHAEGVQVLIVEDRAGVVWGADATWIDLRSGEAAEDAIRIVLNDAEETERRR